MHTPELGNNNLETAIPAPVSPEGERDSLDELAISLQSLKAHNRDAIDYAINLVGNSNNRLKYNLFFKNISDPRFLKGLAPDEETHEKIQGIIDDMGYLTLNEEAESKANGNYMARRQMAKDLVSIFVNLINKQTDDQFANTRKLMTGSESIQ